MNPQDQAHTAELVPANAVPETTRAVTKFTAEHGKEIGLPSPEAINYMMSVSNLLTHSALVTPDMGSTPDQIKSNALAKMLVGHEMGIGPLQALQEIYVVKGKVFVGYPQLISQMMRKGFKLTWTERSHSRAALKVEPPADYPMGPEEFEYTIEDAKKAGLVREGSQYSIRPRVMLAARCASEAFRATGGQSNVYTPEEREEITQEQSERGQAPTSKPSNPYMQGMDEPEKVAAATPDNPTQTTQQGAKAGAKQDEVPAQTVSDAGSGKPNTAAPTSPAPAPESPQPEPPKTEATATDDPADQSNRNLFKDMLDAFAVQKLRLGEPLYYELLEKHGGVKKSNQFKSLALARTAYKIMVGTSTPDAAPNTFPSTDDDLPANMRPAAEPAPAKSGYVEEIKAEIQAISETYPKKSPDAVKKLLDAFMKGFYGSTKPKPDDANIGSIRTVLRLMRGVLSDYPALIVDSATAAAKAGAAVAGGYRECVAYLEGRGMAARAAFWDMAVVRFPDSGGRDALEYFQTIGLSSDWPDADFAAFVAVFQRTRQAHVLIGHAKASGVPIARIVERWGVDVATAPVAGLEAFLKGGVPVADAPTTEPVQEALPGAEELVDDAGDDWLMDLDDDK